MAFVFVKKVIDLFVWPVDYSIHHVSKFYD